MTLCKGKNGARDQQEMLMANRFYTHSPSCMNSCGRTSGLFCAGKLPEVRLGRKPSVGGEMGDQTMRNPRGFATLAKCLSLTVGKPKRSGATKIIDQVDWMTVRLQGRRVKLVGVER